MAKLFSQPKTSKGVDNLEIIILNDPCPISEAPSGVIERVVPNDPKNRDWKNKVDWVAKGNTPDVADVVLG